MFDPEPIFQYLPTDSTTHDEAVRLVTEEQMIDGHTCDSSQKQTVHHRRFKVCFWCEWTKPNIVI